MLLRTWEARTSGKTSHKRAFQDAGVSKVLRKATLSLWEPMSVSSLGCDIHKHEVIRHPAVQSKKRPCDSTAQYEPLSESTGLTITRQCL